MNTMNDINTVLNVLTTLSSTSSTNDKLAILKNNSNNELLKKICKYAYDNISYTYSVSKKTIRDYSDTEVASYNDIEDMFTLLEDLNSRKFTGHAALLKAKSLLSAMPEDIKDLFLKIIDRDLKVGVNTKQLNKVWKNLVPKPNYCRCNVLSDKLLKKFKFPAYIQLKCDGTYREAYVNNGKVVFKTRSGEEYNNPVMADLMKGLKNGYYTGEFTLGLSTEQTDRTKANGLINSDNPPYNNIHFTIWDYLSEDEYNGYVKTPYNKRFSNLLDSLNNSEFRDENEEHLIHVVPTNTVNNIQEALKIVSEWMEQGLEGGVLKSFDMLFKNGTSNEQLKIKLKVDAEMRCTGFIKGTEGTKYEHQNKVIVFENDEGTVKGQCSGMTDEMVEEVTKNADKYIGKILSVQFNDLQKAEGHDFYALSHPRFREWRDDKDCCDTLEKVIKLRDMAKSL